MGVGVSQEMGQKNSRKKRVEGRGEGEDIRGVEDFLTILSAQQTGFASVILWATTIEIHSLSSPHTYCRAMGSQRV